MIKGDFAILRRRGDRIVMPFAAVHGLLLADSVEKGRQ